MDNTATKKAQIALKGLAAAAVIGSAFGAIVYKLYLKPSKENESPADEKVSPAGKSAPSCIGESFKVELEGTDAQGLEFAVGDMFTVIKLEGEMLVIDKLGDENNPYTVETAFLLGISTLSKDMLN